MSVTLGVSPNDLSAVAAIPKGAKAMFDTWTR